MVQSDRSLNRGNTVIRIQNSQVNVISESFRLSAM